MLHNSEQRDATWFRDNIFDVCIVGSGPAGMSLALKLAERGWKIGLFEGGDLKPTQESTDIYAGRNVGLDYIPLDSTRLRYFGGTSNHWEGMCRQLEAFDFDPVPYSPVSGWPIRKTDLDPYAPQVEKILDVKPAGAPFDLFGGQNGALVPFQFRWSKPTRFGSKYQETLAASPNINVFLNANLVDLDLAEGRHHVTSAIFRTYRRPEPFTVRARYFVICLGGLENPRFLLNANRQIPGGIGNDNGLVGRFFCEHMTFHIGQLFLEPHVQATFPQHLYFHPTREFMLANRINDFGLRMEDGLIHSPDSALRTTVRRAMCDYPVLNRVAKAMRGVESDCFDAPLRIIAAQALNPDSRVLLGDELDRFGNRRIRLDWRLAEIDKVTLKVAALEFGKQLVHTGTGRLKINDWLLDPRLAFPTTAEDEVGGNHHMCTTRMSDDPKSGVVDRDCRMHSLDNFYVGGSSVFATPGFCNPTFTIVQLSLRLADHLDGRLKSAASR